MLRTSGVKKLAQAQLKCDRELIARSGGIMHLALCAQQICHAVQAQGGHCQILLVRHFLDALVRS
jgi:hypothetical protein